VGDGPEPWHIAGVSDVAGWLRDYEVAGVTVRALGRVLRRCREEGIAVLLVAPPLSRPHRTLYTPAVEAAFRACIDKLTRRYGCRFVDYRDRLPEHGFADHHHVNGAGGEYFSRVLAREVLIPAWRDLCRGSTRRP
jgi:hypothetical protein